MTELLHAHEVLECFRRGDEKAFATIFQFFYPRLVVFSYRVVKNEAEAQDIASRVLEKLHRRAQVYQSMDHLESFLYFATRNESINYLKYLKTFTENYREYVTTHFDEIDLLNHQLDAALLEKLYQSIERLPERSKQVINYLYIQKLPYQKIADLMETTVKNIENIRSYALKKLRTDLNPSSNSSAVSPAVLVLLAVFFLCR